MPTHVAVRAGCVILVMDIVNHNAAKPALEGEAAGGPTGVGRWHASKDSIFPESYGKNP